MGVLYESFFMENKKSLLYKKRLVLQSQKVGQGLVSVFYIAAYKMQSIQWKQNLFVMIFCLKHTKSMVPMRWLVWPKTYLTQNLSLSNAMPSYFDFLYKINTKILEKKIYEGGITQKSKFRCVKIFYLSAIILIVIFQ